MKRIFAFAVFLLFLAGLALVNLASMKPASGAWNDLPASSTSGKTADAAGVLSVDEIRRLTARQTPAALELFREFLSVPNDARHPDDILRMVSWLETRFGALGFETRRLPTAGSPLLLAERRHDGAEKTVLVYLQADGQPVDPSHWQQDDPYQPVLKERDADGNWHDLPWDRLLGEIDPDWRIFARSASDSKGPMTQFMAAIAALDDAGITPDFNLKVIIDTEEELGSPHLAAAVEEHRERLAADLLLIFDGPPHASNAPTVSFGARGIVDVTLVSYGPRVPQHSGHYGNFVPNPAQHMARILGSLKSIDGRVLIPGFYDGISLDNDVREILANVPDDEAALRRQIGFARPDAVAATLQEALQYPSLNIRGLSSAWVGPEARTIIPDTATAEIDIRLVLESDPARLVRLLRTHIEDLGYYVIDRAPTEAERLGKPYIVAMTHNLSYNAFRSDFDGAAGLLARAGMRHLYGHEPILIRTMGGSIPIAPFVTTLAIPAATVPTVNIDNNQHSPNENIELQFFIKGISIIMSVLSQPLQ
ncbi:MAG: M20/M25/M40 family metallo-hydrolase [Woeseia sp.]